MTTLMLVMRIKRHWNLASKVFTNSRTPHGVCRAVFFFASFVRRGAAGPFSPARAERGRPSFSPGPFGKGALPNKRAFYAGSSFLSSDLATILPSSICTVRCSTSLPCDSTMSVARASSTSFSTARRRLRAPYFSL